jgi:hemerythrin-like domain-containing protein
LQGLTDALEVYVAALDAGQPLAIGDLSDLVNAFRTAADYRHFEKVEEVLIPLLVRSGFDFDLDRVDDGRHAHERIRYLIEVLHQSAERELCWNLDERQRIARAARHLIEEQRRITARQAVELFPEIVTRLEAPALGQLTQQLCHFDEASAARGPELDISAVSESVFARYATPLPPPSSSPDLPESLEALQSLQSSRDLPSTRELAR